MSEKAKMKSLMPSETEFKNRLSARHQRGKIWQGFYYFSIGLALLALIILFLNVVNRTFGTIAVQNEVAPMTLTEAGTPLNELNAGELSLILLENTERKLRVYIRDTMSQVDSSLFTKAPIREVLAGHNYPEEFADLTINDLEAADHAALLASNVPTSGLLQIVNTEIVHPEIQQSWTFFDTLFNYDKIEIEAAEKHPDAVLQGHSWLNSQFISTPMSSTPAEAGIRTALLGTLALMAVVICVALPIGVGAAIYLEEYATDNWLNRLIETNIRNLAGVPSIIYGMLGLAIFVRVMEPLTSGALFGVVDSNGRTILSAGLTLSLLVLPIVVINAQEALRAVPWTLREASYGLGATKWQTIWRQTLPAALPGILTGTILALSRAVGETAPLIVIGASTFILVDPDGPFSKFTALPIQIFQWTARPQDQFRDIAAAAIVVLLVLMLTLNATAILLRNRYSIRY